MIFNFVFVCLINIYKECETQQQQMQMYVCMCEYRQRFLCVLVWVPCELIDNALNNKKVVCFLLHCT